MTSVLNVAFLHLGLAAVQIVTVLGLYIAYGLSGQLSLFQAASFATGAYTAVVILNATSGVGAISQALLAPLAGLLGAGVVAAVAGIVLARTESDYAALLTLAMSELLRLSIGASGWLGGWNGLDVSDTHGIHEATRLVTRLTATTWMLFLAAALIRWVRRSRHGESFVVAREMPVLLPFLGLSPSMVRIRAFVFGSALAGLAGGTYAFLSLHVTPELASIWKAIELLALAVLAGESLAAVAGIAGLVYLLRETLFFLDFRLPVPFSATGSAPVQQVWPAFVSMSLVLVLIIRGRRTWRPAR